MTDTWSIAPLALGSAVRDRCQSLLGTPPGIEQHGAILAWLLRNGADKILVDTGAFGRIDRPDISSRYDQTPDQTMESQLRRFDAMPEEINLVVLTHLHLDHAGGNSHFPWAGFIVQKSELEYALNPLPVHKGGYDMDFSAPAFELLTGDAEIVPGIRVVLTPGHSPGSQAVLVDTEAGLYIIAGDSITHYVNMDVAAGDSFCPNAIYVDLRDFYRSLDRLRDLGGVILPGHDPLVLKQTVYP